MIKVKEAALAYDRDTALSLALNTPLTAPEKVRAAAMEMCYLSIEAKTKWGKDALVLIPRELGHTVGDALLVTFPKKKAMRIRALETSRWNYIRDIERLARITKIPCRYVPLDQAINAYDGTGVPGGPFAWWELCSEKGLLHTAINTQRSFERIKPVRRMHLELHKATHVPKKREPVRKLIPTARNFHRPHGNVLRRRPR